MDDLLDKRRDLNNLQEDNSFMLDDKTKNNMKTYIKLLPWTGLISGAILAFYYFVIEGVDYDIGWAILYCLVPFFVFTAISIPLRIAMRRQSNEELTRKRLKKKYAN